ncbi:MAG: hypothetical protein ED557_14835 [Balneola sp.]|nr:MAG: hypothetical protein ED557_14835 [Balneola sp.]
MRYFFFMLLFLSSCSGFLNEQELEESIWIGIASAERQCIFPDFASLKEAVVQLEENQIPVLDSREVVHGVCLACSCPTGIVYQALINKQFLDEAEELGWSMVDEGDDTTE